MKRRKFLPRYGVVDRVDEIVRLCRGKTVLNVGMGGYVDDPGETRFWVENLLPHSVHLRAAGVAKELVGLDINPGAIEAMREAVPGEYIRGDITSADLHPELEGRFELVVFGEILEHLDDFRRAFSNIRHYLGEDGRVVVSTINAFGAEPIVKMLFRYEDVHDEHTAWFSRRTLERLLEMNRFEIEEFSFCNQRRTIFPNLPNRVLWFFHRAFGRLFPQFSQGILAVAKPVQARFP